MHIGRRAVRTVIATVAAACVVLPATAGAHGGTATMAVEIRPGPTTDQVEVRARITYDNDGDAAPGATVAATLLGPVDQSVPVTPADNGDGTYTAMATVSGPGAWTAQLVATNPDATVEASFTVEPSPPTTTTDASSEPRPTLGDETTTTDTGSDGSSAIVWIAGLGGLIALVAIGSVVWVRRGRRAKETSR